MRNINLLHIYAKSFKKIDEISLSLDSDDSLLLIKGANGTGKSSILESIYTTLYGSKTGTTDQEVIQKSKDQSVLELEIDIDGDLYLFKRILGKNNSFTITRNGELVSDKSSLSKTIAEDLIPKFLFEISMMSIKSKNEIKSLIKETAYNIVNLDDIFNKLKNKINDLNKEKTNLDIELSNKKGLLEELSRNKESFINRSNSLNSNIVQYKSELEKIDIELSNISSIDEIINLSDKVNKLTEEKYDELTKQYREELNRLNAIKLNLSKELSNYELEKSNILSRATAEKQSIDNEKQKLISEVNFELRNIDQYTKQEIHKLSELENHLKIDTCPLCGQVIQEDTKKKTLDLIKQSKEAIKQLEDRKLIISNKFQEIESNITLKINEAKSRYAILINTSSENIIRINSEISNINQSIDNQNLSLNQINRNGIYDDIISKLNIEKSLITNVKYYINLYNNKTSYLSNIDSSNSELNYIQTELEKISDIELNENNNIISISKESDALSEDLYIYNFWNDVKLFRTILFNKISLGINQILKDKYKSLIEITFEMNEKDSDILVKNLNGEQVQLENLSQGEFSMVALNIICAFRDILSTKFKFNWLLLDEFLDKLDQDNMITVLEFIKSNIKGKVFVITHNTYAMDFQGWSDIIDMGGDVE
jgi:DNA repair exonuclease SbcCD ATPase subunit